MLLKTCTPGHAPRVCSLGKISALALLAMLGGSGSQCSITIDPNGNDTPQPNCTNASVLVIAGDHTLGSAGAPVTVVEYSDFQCPFCGKFARETFPTIRTNYIDTGKVRWVLRHFPLRNIHPNAENSSQASECASDQGKFWEYGEVLFNNQNSLDVASLKAFAAQLGMSSATFDPCLDGGGKAARVQSDVDSGTALGLIGTPTFFVNGKCYAGAYTVARFSLILDAAIAEASP